MLKNKLSIVEYVNKVLKSNTFNKSIPEGFLSNINNKKIKINLEDLEYSFIIHIKDNSLQILDKNEDIDVEIIATSAILILFILSKGSDKFSSKIIINGDIDTANKFNNFLSSSEKIKEIIVHLLGEEKSAFIEKKIYKISSFFKDIFRSSSNDIVDLLIDDLNLLPSKADIDRYLDDVDNLKSRTDKLYQKFKNVK